MTATEALLYVAAAETVVGGYEAIWPDGHPRARKRGTPPTVRRAHRLACYLAAVHQYGLAPGAVVAMDAVWASRCQLAALGALPFRGPDAARIGTKGLVARPPDVATMRAGMQALRRMRLGAALATGAEPPTGYPMPWGAWA